jgi:hypothetical protein
MFVRPLTLHVLLQRLHCSGQMVGFDPKPFLPLISMTKCYPHSLAAQFPEKISLEAINMICRKLVVIVAALGLLVSRQVMATTASCSCEHYGSAFDGICEARISPQPWNVHYTWNTIGGAFFVQTPDQSGVAIYDSPVAVGGGLIVTISYWSGLHPDLDHRWPLWPSFTLTCTGPTGGENHQL